MLQPILIEDTPNNRAISFCLRFVEIFSRTLKKKNENVEDRSQSKPSGTFSKAGKNVGEVAGGIALLALAAPGPGSKIGGKVGEAIGTPIDAVTGKNTRKGDKKVDANIGWLLKQNETAQSILIKVGITIFANYNIQLVELCKSPKDGWRQAMRKFADDAVHRIFNGCKEETAEIKTISDAVDYLIKCFLAGKSETHFSKVFTNGKATVGRQIKCQMGQIRKLSRLANCAAQFFSENDLRHC